MKYCTYCIGLHTKTEAFLNYKSFPLTKSLRIDKNSKFFQDCIHAYINFIQTNSLLWKKKLRLMCNNIGARWSIFNGIVNRMFFLKQTLASEHSRHLVFMKSSIIDVVLNNVTARSRPKHPFYLGLKGFCWYIYCLDFVMSSGWYFAIDYLFNKQYI